MMTPIGTEDSTSGRAGTPIARTIGAGCLGLRSVQPSPRPHSGPGDIGLGEILPRRAGRHDRLRPPPQMGRLIRVKLRFYASALCQSCATRGRSFSSSLDRSPGDHPSRRRTLELLSSASHPSPSPGWTSVNTSSASWCSAPPGRGPRHEGRHRLLHGSPLNAVCAAR
jgi:hypothetical protein